jgi:hypothetical protein
MTTAFKSPFTVIIIGALALLMIAIMTLVPTMSAPPVSYSSTGGVTTIMEDEKLTAVNATIVEALNGHAWLKHGKEVNDAFKCLNDNGSSRSFKTFGMVDEAGNPIPTNSWFCFNGKDWYVIVTTTLEKVGGNRIGRLVTAYMIDKVKYPVIDSFIDYLKTSWRAIEINFIIEAGSVFLQPK